jgi:threonine/homoserine efflux transporter RhtA
MGSLLLQQHLPARVWFAIALVIGASAGAALEITGRRIEPPEV